MNPCTACTHPARELIDRFCQERRLTLEEDGRVIRTAIELSAYLEETYPNVKAPSTGTLSNHRQNHVLPGDMRKLAACPEGGISAQDGQIVPHTSAMDLLQLSISTSADNIRKHPERVTPTQGLEAVAIMIKILGGIKDQGERNQAWLDYLKKLEENEGKPKRRRKVIDADPQDD
jgi:hypothetical protein